MVEYPIEPQLQSLDTSVQMYADTRPCFVLGHSPNRLPDLSHRRYDRGVDLHRTDLPCEEVPP